MEKKVQEEVVSYRLDGQSSGIKKKIHVGIKEGQEDDLAEAVGKVYLNIILAVCVLEAAKLSEDKKRMDRVQFISVSNLKGGIKKNEKIFLL